MYKKLTIELDSRPLNVETGLLAKEADDIIVLSGLIGEEDHLADMDFKVYGTDERVTDLQMDMKIKGFSRKIMSKIRLSMKAVENESR
ncbi:MAG: hypothetical protein JXA35_05150 [Deltaproteobacteria bacterium]|nr:hypothetical protein [Deltaproteobacteria bacterium]